MDWRGKGAFGETEHDDDVEIETDAHGDRAHEHAVAEAPDPAEVVLELEGERASEHVEIDRAFHRIKCRQPIESSLDPLGGLSFVGRPTARATVRAADESR